MSGRWLWARLPPQRDKRLDRVGKSVLDWYPNEPWFFGAIGLATDPVLKRWGV